MGKPSRDKGYRREREAVQMFRSWGLHCERVPLSGGTDYAKGDVDLYLPRRDAPLVGEVKARATMPRWLAKAIDEADFVLMHGDRSEPFVVVPLRTFKEMAER